MAIGRVDVDLRSFDRAVRKMVKAGGDARKVWRKLRTPLRRDQRDHMRAQESSSGAKWAPLSSSTIEGRLARGGRAGKFTKRGKLKKGAARRLNRVLSAKLLTGAKVRIDRRFISITSKVPWAGIHQAGGVAGRNSRIPQREFMWIGDPLAKLGAKMLAKHIADAFNKGG